MDDDLHKLPQFTLVLGSVNKAIFIRFSWFLYAIALSILALLIIFSVSSVFLAISICSIIISVGLLIYLSKFTKIGLALAFFYAALPLSVAFAALGYFVIGCLFLLLFFVNYKQTQGVTVNVYESVVSIGGFPKKNIQWPLLNNIVLKDGLLTIDKKNNKLFQQTIINYQDIEETSFNSFCRSKIESS